MLVYLSNFIIWTLLCIQKTQKLRKRAQKAEMESSGRRTWHCCELPDRAEEVGKAELPGSASFRHLFIDSPYFLFLFLFCWSNSLHQSLFHSSLNMHHDKHASHAWL